MVFAYNVDLFLVIPAVERYVVMERERRRIVQTGVAKNPTDEWPAQQLREATAWGRGPKYLIRDRDSKYARRVQKPQPRWLKPIHTFSLG